MIDGVSVGRAPQCLVEELPEYSIFTPWLSEGLDADDDGMACLMGWKPRSRPWHE